MPPGPNQVREIAWDMRDHLGRRVEGATAHVSVGFGYDVTYTRAGTISPFAFGLFGKEFTVSEARDKLVLWKKSDLVVSAPEGSEYLRILPGGQIRGGVGSQALLGSSISGSRSFQCM